MPVPKALSTAVCLRSGDGIARWRQRTALGELAAFNQHMLRDIGVSMEDALREAEKPFWRR
jgi:uncharacterized protein YjiS (DUF1127 family)